MLIEMSENKRFNFGCALKKMAGPAEKLQCSGRQPIVAVIDGIATQHGDTQDGSGRFQSNQVSMRLGMPVQNVTVA